MRRDWRHRALCRNEDPELFTAEGETGAHVEQARHVCARCPVADACLEWATTRREKAGVWAGLTPGERERLIRTRHIPAVPTPSISDMVDAIALADRMDGLGQRNRVWVTLREEFALPGGRFREWKERFDGRLDGSASDPSQNIMRVS